MFEKQIVIDAKGHMMGRLASIVAKNLLSGQRIVIVRVEQCVLSGSLYNRRVEYLEYKNKNSNTNPRHGGPYHWKSPSKLFWKALRGMLPHKTKRGTAALEKIKIFEGCPYPYSHMKKQYCAKALKQIRLHNGKCCLLRELSKSVGWNKSEIVQKLEKKRLERGSEYYGKKMAVKKELDNKLKGNKEVEQLRTQLAEFGY